MVADKSPTDIDSGSRRRSGRGSVKRTYAESEGTGSDNDEHEEEKPVSKSRSQRATSSTSAKTDKNAKKKKTQLSPEFIEDSDEDNINDGLNTNPKKTAQAKDKPASSSSSKEPAVASNVLVVGDHVPSDVRLIDQKSNEVTTGALTEHRGAVIFIVPKANTPGCTTQACSFRDDYSEFHDRGYDVYSLSQDSPTVLTNWKSKQELPFGLLSDPTQSLIKQLGASKSPKSVQRSHFIVGQGGKLLLSSVGVSPKNSKNDCLAFIKDL